MSCHRIASSAPREATLDCQFFKAGMIVYFHDDRQQVVEGVPVPWQSNGYIMPGGVQLQPLFDFSQCQAQIVAAVGVVRKQRMRGLLRSLFSAPNICGGQWRW
eukprot:jgi/Chlat1/197/Chrsp1S03260